MRRSMSSALLALVMTLIVATAAAWAPPETRVAGQEVIFPPAPPSTLASPTPDPAPTRDAIPGELHEDAAGAWEWAYLVAGQGRGNIVYVTTTVNLHEHQLHLYVPVATPASFVIYRGTSLTGAYTLIDEAGYALEPGNGFYSSGPRDCLLEAGSYYYIGASWQDSVVYARANALPPQEISFGTVCTSVPQNLPGYPPNPQGMNSSTGYPAAHQVLVTGLAPAADAPEQPTDLLAASLPDLLGAELDWVNPIYSTNGDPLDDLDGVRIYRDGALVEILTEVEIGMPMLWVDRTVRRAGCYTYRVTGFNDAGCGWGNDTRLWVGQGTGVYDWSAIPYDWTEISAIGTDTGIIGDDQSAGPFALGFDFPFYGTQYDAVRISSNGFLSLTSFASPPINARIPDATGPNGLIAPYWDDLTPEGRGEIYVYEDGSVPRYVVEWHDLPCWGLLEGHYTFQAVLYPDGTIDFLYRELTAGVPDAATVGIEDPLGINGLELCYCIDGPCRPVPESAVRFTPRLVPEAADGPPGASELLRLAPPVPNPSRGQTRLSLELGVDQRLDVRVIDSAGRVVRTLHRGPAARGARTLTWDGRSDHGTLAPEGVYFFRAEGLIEASRRAVLIR